MKQLFYKKTNKLQRIEAIFIAIILSLVFLNSCRTSEVIQKEEHLQQDSAFAANLTYNAEMLDQSIAPIVSINNIPTIHNTFVEHYTLMPVQYVEDEISKIVEVNNVEEIKEEIPEYITHIVMSKDSLWSLAIEYYNDPYLFTTIKEYNHLKSNTIIDGQELKIPNVDNICIESSVSYSSYESASQVEPETNENGMIYIGDYKITGYNPWCVHCCSTDDGITASGVEAEVGRTIAMKGYPYGTEVYIEGYGYYVVEDTGSFKNNTIDIACNSHEECYSITNLQGVAVYLVEGE